MENYNVDNHLFFDGYNLNESYLKDPSFVSEVMNSINHYIFSDKGKITLLPYFNGKVKKDGGVSGVILGDGFHFTCHTFCYKNTVFIDYFGDEEKKIDVLNIIFDYFKTDDYDMGSKDIKGNFGKHIIVRPKVLSFDDAQDMVKLILKEIDMTPITNLIINKKSNEYFDILQPIAESHISFHRKEKDMVVDAFSCKYFDVNKFMSLLKENDNYIEVNRGIHYR